LKGEETAMERPRDGEYAPFYARYVALVPETDSPSP